MSASTLNSSVRDAANGRSKRAVIYLRVSTAKQVGKDDDPDGYSLPAQEEACRRKAETLDAEVVEVFVDRGESAKTADRRAFQRMLAFVKGTPRHRLRHPRQGRPFRPQPARRRQPDV